MSEENVDIDNVISNLEADLKGTMPEDCYEYFKKFTLCKLDYDEELKKTKSREEFALLKDEAMFLIRGCKKEYYTYEKCYNNFYRRYVDLKNYVAELEGKQKPFLNKKEIPSYIHNRHANH